jgi:hypothetical protein
MPCALYHEVHLSGNVFINYFRGFFVEKKAGKQLSNVWCTAVTIITLCSHGHSLHIVSFQQTIFNRLCHISVLPVNLSVRLGYCARLWAMAPITNRSELCRCANLTRDAM